MKGELLNRLPLCDPDQSKQHNLQEREFGILDFLPCCLWGNITALSRRARHEHPVHCAVAILARILAKSDDCCRHDFKVGGPCFQHHVLLLARIFVSHSDPRLACLLSA